MAEVAIPEFINQYMYDFRSIHVGKDLYRAKEHEEDIQITNEIHNIDFPVSLKAYGHGPLQLSTDKPGLMFARLKQEGEHIVSVGKVKNILADPVFTDFTGINVLPLIYNERAKQCNIIVFDYERACESTVRISYEGPGGRRKHPVYKFYDSDNSYVCEVRYGLADANALQRGLWTHTKNALKYFDSLTNGWIDYSDNHVLCSIVSSRTRSNRKRPQNSTKENQGRY